MRILLVTYWGLTNLGGIWTYMKQLSDKLAQQGHEVTLMGSHVDSNTLYLLDRNAYFDKKAYYSALLPYLDPLQFPHLHQEHGIFSFELGRYVFEGGAAALGLEQYDVIHAQDPISAYALRRVMKKAVPLVASMHGALARESYYEYRGLEPGLTREEYEKRPIWSYFRRMEQLAVHAADLILVSSKWIGQVVGGHGVTPDRIHIQPYGVNLKEYEAKALMPSPLKRRQGKKLIMYAGRLEYIKGVHILIRALGLLQQRRQDWTCVIAGSGSLLEELKLQAQAMGVQDNIEFTGTIDNIPAALTSADIYVQPSLQDTQPFSVTEAQLAGIAPVVAGTTGMPEMVQHGLTGWIVPADNAAALAGQLELLLRDDSLRARAGSAAQRWARANRSLDTMVEGTLKVYRRAAKMPGWPQRSRPARQSGHLIQGAFHPADLLNVITPGNPLESVLRSRLPADYRIPDANILPG